ncbi:MAG: hypothetical protein HZB15_02770 [Actinobacteria bacterium]|nr:hypothetical protein [Actinomycetota bacterium]
MEVRFRKGKDGRTCSWVAIRPPRSQVPGPTTAAGGDVPHDLATFVIEDALRIEHGFWGCVADGATFRSLRRTRTQPGREVIRRHADELDDAERRVNEIYFAWRDGRSTPVDEVLDRTLDEWRRLPEAGELVRVWPRRGRQRK